MDDRLDALRRRLYEPGSTATDLEAYRAAESERPESERQDAASHPAPPRRRGRTRAAAITVLALAAAAAAALFLVVTRPAEHPTAAPSTTAPGAITVPRDTRERFAADLDAGRDPGLLDYLDGHPAALLTALRSAGRADSTAFTGSGPTTLALSPTTAEEHAGHLTVVLVTDRDARYAWRATIVAEGNDRSGPEPPVASHDGAARRGGPVAGTVGYDGGVPTGLTLLLPTGIRWAAVVVYTD